MSKNFVCHLRWVKLSLIHSIVLAMDGTTVITPLNTSLVLLDAKDPSFLHMSQCCTFEPQLLFCGRPRYRATKFNSVDGARYISKRRDQERRGVIDCSECLDSLIDSRGHEYHIGTLKLH